MPLSNSYQYGLQPRKEALGHAFPACIPGNVTVASAWHIPALPSLAPQIHKSACMSAAREGIAGVYQAQVPGARKECNFESAGRGTVQHCGSSVFLLPVESLSSWAAAPFPCQSPCAAGWEG